LRNNGLVIFNLVEGVHNDYYHEEAKLGYTWIAIGLSLIICVPLAISIVMRHHDKFTYSSRF
jgi:heme exporter protein D